MFRSISQRSIITPFNFCARYFSTSSDVKCTPFQAVRMLQCFIREPSADSPIILKVNVDADLSRESVRGVSTLPHGISKKVRLAVFCPDDEAENMIKAGADFAGITELSTSIASGRVEFDRCLATPDVMPRVVRLAKVLGPLKLMPNQKSGTVVTNLTEAIEQCRSGAQVEFRAEGEGTIQIQVGHCGFNQTQVLDNVKKVVKDIIAARPRSSMTMSDSGDSAVFQYPPAWKQPLNIKKTDTQSKEFILVGSLQSPGCPEVFIEGGMLKPTSTGYFR